MDNNNDHHDHHRRCECKPSNIHTNKIAAFIGQRKGARGPKGDKKFFADFNDNIDEFERIKFSQPSRKYVGSRVVAATGGRRRGVVGGRFSTSFRARSGCCCGCLGPGFGARIGSLGGRRGSSYGQQLGGVGRWIGGQWCLGRCR
jgi:hypothetical protein